MMILLGSVYATTTSGVVELVRESLLLICRVELNEAGASCIGVFYLTLVVEDDQSMWQASWFISASGCSDELLIDAIVAPAEKHKGSCCHGVCMSACP